MTNIEILNQLTVFQKQNERLNAELNQARAELQNARNDNDGLLLTVQELRYNISHAYTLPDGDFLSVEELGQKFTTNESKLASLMQELEQLRVRYAGAVELAAGECRAIADMNYSKCYREDDGFQVAGDTAMECEKAVRKALSSTPQSVKDVIDVLEAVKAYDSAISALEKEHGRKDMELTQHSKLVPIRELARKL